MKTCDIIGISDNRQQWFAPEVMNVIQGGHVFSGGRRHHEIVAPLLPSDAVWLDITVPLESVFKQYEAVEHVVIFASGDPLFYGFANTVQRKCKGVVMRVFPSFNSLQMLAHRLLLPYHDMRIVSLTGRPWQEFDRALMEQAAKVGILTDREHTPSAIARRMLEYGYTHYQMHVGEHLGNPQAERVATLTLEEAATSTFAMPNCVILEGNRSLPTREGGGRVFSTFGLPDSSFALLDGRAKMITKMPIRLLTLQALDLTHRHTLWDIGACTGSVSIEARLLFPHLHVVAFEIRPECEAIICENARRHGAPGIEVRIGDFLEDSPPALPNREGAVTKQDLSSPSATKVSAPSLQGCQEERTECSYWTGSGGESSGESPVSYILTCRKPAPEMGQAFVFFSQIRRILTSP